MIKQILQLILILPLFGCAPQQKAALKKTPERIISLAPDITEAVYALGLGEKLAGATTYCLYPEAAKKIPRVGGFGQFNFEAIVSLKPDVILLHRQYESEKSRLDGLGIPYIETNTKSIADILQTIHDIGRGCGAEEEAGKLMEDINRRLKEYENQMDRPPRVLVTFGGEAGSLDRIHAFGRNCLHHELLEIAGGRNVVENSLSFSTLSKEAVIRLNPDIIIQLSPGTKPPVDPLAAWQSLPGISAVKNRQVFVLTGDYTCIPGPRFIQILNDFSEIIRHYNQP